MSQPTDKLGAILAGGLVALVLGGSIAGLMLVGGPGEARALKLDEARLNLMVKVETQMYCHYLATNAYPADRAALGTLMEEGLSSPPAERSVLIDQACGIGKRFERRILKLPEEGFDYRLTDAGQPEMCVTFLRAPSNVIERRAFRAHTIFPKLSDLPDTPGRHCFIGAANPLEED